MFFLHFNKVKQNNSDFTKADYSVLDYDQLLRVNGAGGGNSGGGQSGPSSGSHSKPNNKPSSSTSSNTSSSSSTSNTTNSSSSSSASNTANQTTNSSSSTSNATNNSSSSGPHYIANTNEAVANAKPGDVLIRDDGTEVVINQGDINWAQQHSSTHASSNNSTGNSNAGTQSPTTGTIPSGSSTPSNTPVNNNVETKPVKDTNNTDINSTKPTNSNDLHKPSNSNVSNKPTNSNDTNKPAGSSVLNKPSNNSSSTTHTPSGSSSDSNGGNHADNINPSSNNTSEMNTNNKRSDETASVSNMGIAVPVGKEWNDAQNVSSTWGHRESFETPNGNTSDGHNGMDFAAPEGTRINAVKDGVVTKVETDPENERGYGLYVEITHSDGTHTLYGHQSEILVTEGQAVSAGEEIGLVGSTGMATGPHLHFSYDGNGDGVYSRTDLSDNPAALLYGDCQ